MLGEEALDAGAWCAAGEGEDFGYGGGREGEELFGKLEADAARRAGDEIGWHLDSGYAGKGGYGTG